MNLLWRFRLLGDSLVRFVSGTIVSVLRMVDGLVTLVDAVNLKASSFLPRKVLGLEAEGAIGRS